MSTPVDPLAEGAPPRVCRRVRSMGTPGVRYEPSVEWASGFVSSATFWCVATGECVGPDDDQVHPHVCGEARECFRAPLDDAGG